MAVDIATLNRGRFRQMNIVDLQASSSLKCWDDESSRHDYDYPIHDDAKSPRALRKDIPEDQLYTLKKFWCAKSPQSHIGPFKNAIDFLVQDGTPVFAVRDGTIIECKEDSQKWGDGEEFRDHLNYLTIQHQGHKYMHGYFSEFSQYAHLEKGSVSACGLGVGSQVKAGQMIGKVGKSGWTDRDHLHFIVFRNLEESGERKDNPFTFKSLNIWFKSNT